MSEQTAEHVRALVDDVYREESRRVFATLIRLLGDFDLAEDALHNAFAAALEQWPRTGVPENPRAWLVSAGRFKAIDALRRRARFDAAMGELADRLDQEANDPAIAEDDGVEEAQTALTLREVCGLTTEDVARAFLVPAPTLAQRIVRAKAKIREARIPYRVPPRAELPERLEGVLRVIYLVFNEGYSASAGDSLTRPDLSSEAIRLAPQCPHHARWRPHPAGGTGPLALGRTADLRRDGAGEAGAVPRPDRPLHHPGGDRRGARAGAGRRRDGLGPDSRPLRPADAGSSLPGRRAEPRRGRGDA
jgi:DNA-directed RNA polymerase specialized sigma24 family protein